MGNIVSGVDFLLALEKAGVLQCADQTRRVVIDASATEALVIYIENYGDERILKVVTHPDLRVTVQMHTDGSEEQR